MRRLEPVIWAKGTFLNPQYLQIQDRFLEDSLQFKLNSLYFRPWGFGKLRIDQEALAAGTFAISEASGILPDGLLFDMPRSDAPPPPRPLAPHFGPDQASMDVFLAVPRYREGGLNVGNGRRDVETRYRAEAEVVRDENTGQSEKPVLVARKNFRFLIEGEDLEGSAVLRVGRIRKTAAGLFRADPHFIPPILELNASDYLVSIARRLVEILAAKSTEMAGMRRQKNEILADFSASDIPNFWLLYTMNTAFPLLRHLFETRGGHPETLFAAMLGLAGALSTFSNKIRPRDLPTYDHDNLGACFTDLDEKIKLLLETVIPSNFVSLPLKQVKPSIYGASIDRDEYLLNTRMYLAVRAESTPATLIGRAPQLLKVGSGDSIEHLIERALSGVPLTHVAAPPSAIPVKMNYQYFSLSQSGEPWDAVVRARNMAVYVPGDFPNPQMELLILLREKA